MAVKLICASHSPLMEFATPQEHHKEQAVRKAFAQLAVEVKAYNPTLIITFGPDHFNGFFYDLMPSFCVGIRAKAAGDWDYGKDNGAAVPMPTTKRTIALGRAVGQFIQSLNLENERILILGTGGLSHDPPTPQMGSVPPEVEEFLIAGHNPRLEARDARQAKVIAVGQKLAVGDTSVSVPLNRDWDLALLEKFKQADFAALEAMSEAEIRRDGGRGGQEVRAWIAAFAALHEIGDYKMTTHCYEDISEWIAGFGIVSAELAP